MASIIFAVHAADAMIGVDQRPIAAGLPALNDLAHRRSRRDQETKLKTNAIFRAICGLALSFTLAGAVAAAGADVDKVMGQGGLKKTSVKGLALAYARPGATLASYKRVMIDPVQVAFDKNWDPERAGGRIKMSKERKEEIRVGVAQIVQEEYARELAKGNYQV